MRGRTQLFSQFIISDLRLNPRLDETAFELDLSLLRDEALPTANESPSETPSPAVTHFEGLIGGPLPHVDLRNLENEPFEFSSSDGKPLLLNFWAPWCGPCRAEFPVLQELFDHFSGELKVGAVAVQDSRINVRKFVAGNPQYSFTIAIVPDLRAGPSELEKRLGIEGIPVR